MQFPNYRAQRTRDKVGVRRLLRETELTPGDLISPIWVCDGKSRRDEIASMPGVFQYSVDRVEELVKQLQDAGVRVLLLCGVAAQRDQWARDAVKSDGPVPRAAQRIRARFPDVTLMTDVDLAAYTPAGCSAIVEGGRTDNDATLDVMAEMALAHARSGADFVVPSASMDGQVGWIRESLDEVEQDHVGIVSCTARYDSAFACSDPTSESQARAVRYHQLDPANAREAMREASLDVDEGADMLMVRPALPFLDVIARLTDEIDLPMIGCADVREYQLIEAAADRGWVDRDRAVLEALLAIKRAGADAVVTYHALQAARILGS